MKFAVIVVALFVMFGCQNTKGKMARSGVEEELELRVGGKKALNDENVTVRFVSVIEDSRCPKGMNCDSAGNGRINLKFTSASDLQEKTVILNTKAEPQRVEFAGYSVQIKALNPYPVEGSPSYFGNYVATLIVTAL
jgi:hypothetical protein